MKIQHHPEFVTATILNWNPLLTNDKYKDIILNSFRYMIQNQNIKLFAYCIMNNHIHFVWQIIGENKKPDIRRNFFKYTAQQIKRKLEKDDPKFLNHFKSTQGDREFQIWERRPLYVELFSEKVFWQKVDYIHQNPVKARLCINPEEYNYSSAYFYHKGIDRLNILSHFNGE